MRPSVLCPVRVHGWVMGSMHGLIRTLEPNPSWAGSVIASWACSSNGASPGQRHTAHIHANTQTRKHSVLQGEHPRLDASKEKPDDRDALVNAQRPHHPRPKLTQALRPTSSSSSSPPSSPPTIKTSCSCSAKLLPALHRGAHAHRPKASQRPASGAPGGFTRDEWAVVGSQQLAPLVGAGT